MPSLERGPEALDTERGDDPSVVEALEEVARAEARAEAARARVLRLSRQADAASSGQVKTTETADPEDTDGAADRSVGEKQPAPTRSARVRRLVLRRPGRNSLAVAAVVVLICAALGTSGYVSWYHRKAVNERQHAAEFAAAARQAAVTLMSIDPNKARDDVQRIIDDSTGPFKAGIMLSAEELVKSVEQSKVSTKAAVKAVAVESMTDKSAVVLVATRAEVANPGQGAPPARSWRIVMDLQRDAGRIKVSKVEFVP
jgi:Mce-associated membrane protein